MVHCHVWIPHPEKLAGGQFKKTMAWMAYCHERQWEQSVSKWSCQGLSDRDGLADLWHAFVILYLEMFFAKERLGEHVVSMTEEQLLHGNNPAMNAKQMSYASARKQLKGQELKFLQGSAPGRSGRHHWRNRHHLAATGFSKVRGRCWAAQVVLELVSDVLSVSSHFQSGDRAIEPGVGKWWIIIKWAFCGICDIVIWLRMCCVCLLRIWLMHTTMRKD